MQDRVAAFGHEHVRVLAGAASSGQPTYELIPAATVEQGIHDVLSSPGLAHGFAAGDQLRVAADGSFEVLRRGGNLCLVLYPPAAPTNEDIAVLATAFERLGGLVESPPHRRFIVITVPVASGFAAAEEAVSGWAVHHDCQWENGNVYDKDGQPLGWWVPE